ncbi:MAG: phosphoesterase [Deltaproteobacteria bacterium]|nr:phosphoesterase [Deltaproteobacteria bacterium]
MKVLLHLGVGFGLIALATFGAGCGSDDEGDPTADSQHIRTVFLIVMENKAWSEVKGSTKAPYINDALLPMSSYAEDYRGAKDGNLHPSEPNYIWLEAGDNLGITSDDDPDKNHRAETDHFVNLLEEHGVSWRSYQEDISGVDCPLSAVGQYKPKHNPMVFFDDVIHYDTQAMSADPLAPRCLTHVRPFGELTTDLQNNTVARYNFLTPNQCNDMHSKCAPVNNQVQQGDNWLAQWIPTIQASKAYKDGGVILITWDEAELAPGCLGNCPIGMIALSPLAKGGGYHNTIAYDHSSTLKTLQEIFKVSPLLRHAGDPGVNDLGDLFTGFP